MTKWIQSLVLVFMLVGAFSLNKMAKDRAGMVYRLSPVSATKSLEYGKVLPAFSFKGLSGQHYSSKDLLGSWSLVLFSEDQHALFPRKKLLLVKRAQLQIKKYLLLPSLRLYVLNEFSQSHHVLKHYRRLFSHDTVGTVTDHQLKCLEKEMGANDQESRLGVVALVDPRGRLRAVFNDRLLTTRQLVKDYISIAHA